jgi:hypothetical protein
MNRQLLSIPVLLAVAFASGLTLGRTSADEKAKDTTVYELRTYTTHDGKLPDLHKRFRDHTMKIFERVGMKNVIYWTPEDTENTLVYVIAHKSRKAADDSWAAFRDDPEWKKAFADSRKDGPIVMKVEKQFLTATDYSPMK